MVKRRRIILVCLLLVVPICFLFGNVNPSAKAQKLQHAGLAEVDHWTVDVGLQDYRSIAGGQPVPPDPPVYNRKASLKASIITSGKAQGQDWLQTCRFESVQKAEYSWNRRETRATLLTVWDTLVGPRGGLRSLKVRATSSSPWFQLEVLTPLNACIWPELPEEVLSPGSSWDSSLPAQIEARELSKSLNFQWNSHWTWRPPIPGSSEAVATLDLKATASAPLQGDWSGEVLYSVPDQRVVGARGQVKLRFTAPTSQPNMTLVSASEIHYELLRLLPGGRPTP